jgi:hypothetical protein
MHCVSVLAVLQGSLRVLRATTVTALAAHRMRTTTPAVKMRTNPGAVKTRTTTAAAETRTQVESRHQLGLLLTPVDCTGRRQALSPASVPCV